MAMKNLVAIITLSFIYSNFSTLEAQKVTYSGPVEYHLEMIKTAGGGGTDGGYNWNVSVNEKRIIDGSFFVTFTGVATGGFSLFGLTSIDESISYINTVNNEGNDQKTSQACYDDRLVFIENVTPGDSRTQRTSVNTTRINPEKPVIESGQIMFRDNKYILMLMGKMKVNINMETYTEETFPCWDTIIPPNTLSNSTTVDFPIAISGEKTIDNQDVLEGVYVQKNETSNDCNKCLGGMGRMVHGDVNCSYISKITTSWTLVKRSTECNAELSYSRGDVKINGAPAKQGSIKVGAGDVISTGTKSRMELRIGNSTYRLGSKSKLLLTDPCELKPREINDPHEAGLNFFKGRIYSLVQNTVGTGYDYDPNMRTAGVGVRGHVSPEVPLYYVSAGPGFGPSVFQDDFQLSGFSRVQQDNPEKAELIEGYQSLPDNQTAYYLDFEDGIVRDLTALRGTIRVEDDMGLRSMDIPEGTTVSQWNDGTPMTGIVILTK